MPAFALVERDYAAVGEMMTALGPNVERLGTSVKGVTLKPEAEVEYLRQKNGVVHGGLADGRPSLARAEQACEAILALSGTTNGHVATAGFRELERRSRKAPRRPRERPRRPTDHLRRHPVATTAR